MITACAVANGERSHAGIAYFASAAARPNLHLMDYSMCERVVFDDSSPAVATAIQFKRHGEHCVARVSEEVLICAGALQPPQILELSGIGAKDLLSSYGIGLVHENPYVGGLRILRTLSSCADLYQRAFKITSIVVRRWK